MRSELLEVSQGVRLFSPTFLRTAFGVLLAHLELELAEVEVGRGAPRVERQGLSKVQAGARGLVHLRPQKQGG